MCNPHRKIYDFHMQHLTHIPGQNPVEIKMFFDFENKINFMSNFKPSYS